MFYVLNELLVRYTKVKNKINRKKIFFRESPPFPPLLINSTFAFGTGVSYPYCYSYLILDVHCFKTNFKKIIFF